MLVLTALVSILVVCGYVTFWHRRHTRKCLAHLPTYPQLPLIGNAHYWLGDGRQIYLRFAELSEISNQSQLPFVVWMGPFACLAISDLEDIKRVTNEFIGKPYYYNFFRQWLGDGIFTAPAHHWKRNIKKLGRTFTASTVDNFQSVFNLQAQKLVLCLKTEAGQGTFNVLHKYLATSTLKTICDIALGVSETSDSIVTTEYCLGIMKILELIQIRAFKLLLHPELLYSFTSDKREMTNTVNQIRDASERVIKIRQQCDDLKKSKELEDNNEGNSKRSFKSYLDILLELNANDPTFTMEQVRNEIDTIIFGGQETVANSLFYILLMLGSHPDVQDKLYAEIKEIFGNSSRELRKEDLARMTYCEAVINEALRLFPPVPGAFRVADHELQLKSCTVPKGVICFVNIYGVGRSKNYWGSDAHEFRPERFATGSAKDIIPFSAGRRACIGKQYAMTFMKTVLAYCVRELVITTVADIELKLDLMLHTVREDLLQVNLREI